MTKQQFGKLHKKHLTLRIILALITICLSISAAEAADYTVTNTNDSGAGSLRQAILDANNSSEDDSVNFAPSLSGQTITLTSGELSIAYNGTLTINGLGADQLTISGNNTSRVFSIPNNAQLYEITELIINNLTITGGGIYNAGKFTAEFTKIINNQAPNGGGIYNDISRGVGRSMTLSNSIVSNNSATNSGGGIFIQGPYISSVSSGVIINASTFNNNTATGSGGGLFFSGTVNIQITESNISNNSTTNGTGGGIYEAGQRHSSLDINNSTINGNFAQMSGGGIACGGLLTITNTTVNNNTAIDRGGGIYIFRTYGSRLVNLSINNNSAADGGGIYSQGGLPLLGNSNLTIKNNTATNNGGGIYTNDPISIDNSTFNGNSAVGLGGGLYLNASGNVLTNSTFSGNMAESGGGVFKTNISSPFRLKNCTISKNLANNGGGINSQSSGGQNIFKNNIIAANVDVDDGVTPDLVGFYTSQGYNLIGNVGNVVGFNAMGDQVGTSNSPIDPLLAPLADNGGLTQTHALLPGSPAIDKADPNDFPTIDQREIPRPFDGDNSGTAQPDIGAFETTCAYTLSSSSATYPFNGGNGIVNVTATSGCSWTAVSNAPWITITSGSGGTNNGTVSFIVAPNNGAARSETITIAGYNFTIDQDGNCSYSISPTSTNLPAGGSGGTVNVTAGTGCNWTAISNDNWITVTNGSSGSGNGSVDFTVSANTGIARTGTLTIAGQTFTVNQGDGCAFTINPTNQDFSSTGGNGSFSLTASNAGCAWNAVASDNWFSITSGSSGSGNATISFTVSANNSAANRSGTITVGGQTFTINQFAPCTYSVSPTMTNVPSNGEIGVVNVITTQNCNWTAVSNAPWIIITSDSSGSGSGTVDFRIDANSGPARSGTITIADKIFTINQADGCAISLSLTSANFQPDGGNGTFGINTQSGCLWLAGTTDPWITITQGSGSGIGTVNYTVASNTGSARTGMITVNDQTFSVNQESRPVLKTPFDLDGDGRSDVGIFRPSVGEWWYLRSSDGGNRAFQFGTSTDKIVPADYTGDGKTDIAFFRPSSGEWFILRSEDSSFYAFLFGNSDDIPIPADFDGDGKTDAAIYRPSNQTWYIIRSSDNQTSIRQYGATGDLPVAADYDGDNKADLAIYRPSNGQWWVNRTQAGLIVATFGTASDKTVQADYTGDGKADIAFFRPQTREWFVLRSEDFSFYSAPFGAAGDEPTPGDYDGDGQTDFAVYRPSNNTWYLQQTTSGFTAITFGTANDLPIHSAFVR